MTYHDKVTPYPPYDQVTNDQVDTAAYLLLSCGYDIAVDRPHLKMTPHRLAHYLNYWTRPKNEPRFTVFENVSPVIDQMITIGPIDFWACCTHHLLPFFGKAWFGYVPGPKLVGLSMVPLIVKEWCARPWLQETMTQDLASLFQVRLEPDGLGLVTKAMHTCQLQDLGGPPVPEMTFSVMKGSFFRNERTRAEFLTYVGGSQ